MRELGFAIVGCGMIARFHCRALAEIPGTRIAALIGRRSGSAGKLPVELNLVAPSFTDLPAALGRPDVPAVMVCTPPGPHLNSSAAPANAARPGRAKTQSE